MDGNLYKWDYSNNFEYQQPQTILSFGYTITCLKYKGLLNFNLK